MFDDGGQTIVDEETKEQDCFVLYQVLQQPNIVMESVKKLKLFGLSLNNKKTPYVLFGGVLFLWVISYCLVMLYVSNDKTVGGQTGDTFGAINALFSGLAFAGIIYTILLQGEELKAQREEIQLNREEMKLARKEFVAQNSHLERTRFESTLFHVTNSIRLAANNMFYSFQPTPLNEYGSTITGVGAFAHLHDSIRAVTSPNHLSFGDKQKLYNMKIEEQSNDINNYLSSISVVLDYIERFTKDDKAFYYTLVRSSFSAGEIGFLWLFVEYGIDAYINKDTIKEFLQIRI